MSIDKSKSVKFSVLMSVYSKEEPDYLEKSLYSVVNQTLMPSEIILVEDGPLNDELYGVIDEYKKKYSFLKVIKLDMNVGLANALNEGLKECSYNHVARMDTDDFANHCRFEKQIAFLINNPTVDVVGSNINEFDKDLTIKQDEKRVPENDLDIKKYLANRNPFNHMTVIYKKNKVMAVGGYLDCPFFEDYYLWCRMAKNNCSFYNIQECLVDVRAGSDMIGRRGGLKYNKCIFNFQRKMKKLGIVSGVACTRNTMVRIAVSSCPKRIRAVFYKKALRG